MELMIRYHIGAVAKEFGYGVDPIFVIQEAPHGRVNLAGECDTEALARRLLQGEALAEVKEAIRRGAAICISDFGEVEKILPLGLDKNLFRAIERLAAAVEVDHQALAETLLREAIQIKNSLPEEGKILRRWSCGDIVVKLFVRPCDICPEDLAFAALDTWAGIQDVIAGHLVYGTAWCVVENRAGEILGVDYVDAGYFRTDGYLGPEKRYYYQKIRGVIAEARNGCEPEPIRLKAVKRRPA